MTRFVAFGAPKETVDRAASGSKSTGRVTISLLVGASAAVSFLIGSFAGLNHSAQHNHTRGACIALEFAESFGIAGYPQKRQAMRAMTSAGNQHFSLFPKTVEEFESLCVRTWGGDERPRR